MDYHEDSADRVQSGDQLGTGLLTTQQALCPTTLTRPSTTPAEFDVVLVPTRISSKRRQTPAGVIPVEWSS